MGNKRIDEAIEFGESLHKYANVNDVILTKLLTALTIMPKIGFDYDFIVDRSGVVLEITSQSQNGEGTVTEKINLNSALKGTMRVLHVVNTVYNHMWKNNLLNGESEVSSIDHILWSAIDDASINSKDGGDSEELLLKFVEHKTLQLDTFRRMVSRSDFEGRQHANELMASLLVTLNYYTNADVSKIENMSVNKTTFFEGLKDIKSINKAVSFYSENKPNILSTISSRSNMEENKSSYLSGLFMESFRNGRIRASEIKTDKWKDLVGESHVK